jgi:hypothetical protein
MYSIMILMARASLAELSRTRPGHLGPAGPRPRSKGFVASTLMYVALSPPFSPPSLTLALCVSTYMGELQPELQPMLWGAGGV